MRGWSIGTINIEAENFLDTYGTPERMDGQRTPASFVGGNSLLLSEDLQMALPVDVGAGVDLSCVPGGVGVPSFEVSGWCVPSSEGIDFVYAIDFDALKVF